MYKTSKLIIGRYLAYCLIAPMIIACSSSYNQANKTQKPLWYSKDRKAFNILMDQFANNIEEIWGSSEVLIAGPKDYIKYSSDYQTRAHIDFEDGTIKIETLLVPMASVYLKKAIVSTLLMGDEIRSSDLFSSSSLSESKEPFLYGQVIDHENQPIRWEWRAEHFANYLIGNNLMHRRSGNKIVSYITIKLISNHTSQRTHRFLPIVKDISHKYNIDIGLILSIMQIESDFNPYAISRTGAIGLMQVQPHTAGIDIFKLFGKSGQPSKDYLFDPENNIDAGTAYLMLLRDQYLAGIKQPLSQFYAMITAYNGGAGSVLRVFSNDKEKAIKKINAMPPKQVYNTLTKKHPSAESRRYLQRVNNIYFNKYKNY